MGRDPDRDLRRRDEPAPSGSSRPSSADAGGEDAGGRGGPPVSDYLADEIGALDSMRHDRGDAGSDDAEPGDAGPDDAAPDVAEPAP